MLQRVLKSGFISGKTNSVFKYSDSVGLLCGKRLPKSPEICVLQKALHALPTNFLYELKYFKMLKKQGH